MPLSLEEVRAKGALIVEALNARDFDALAGFDFFDNEHSEFNSTIAASEGETYLGVEGMRAWARNVDETWDDFRIELLRIEPAGEGRVVVELRTTGVAKVSGIPLDMNTGQVWYWDERGIFARNDSYTHAQEAFEAAGVPYGPSTRSM